MDKKHDGHAWCKVKTTNIKNDFKLTFWRVRCLGHLQCRNDGCNFFFLNKCRNETTWIGDVRDLQGSCFAPNPPFCKICNSAPFYVNMCVACMYYIVHKQENLIWTTIHLNTHDHPVMEGHFQKVFNQVKFMVEEEVSRTLGAPALAIALVANKTFLF